MAGIGEIKEDNVVKSAIEAFIAANVVPVLPKYSTTQVIYKVKTLRPEEAKEAFPAFILVRLIHALMDKLRGRFRPEVLIMLRAALAERLQAGNCQEQASLAAVKLVTCEHVRSVVLVLDYHKDHAYLEVNTKAGKKYRYDPWLNPKELLDAERHAQELKNIFEKPSLPMFVHRELVTSYRLRVSSLLLEDYTLPSAPIRALQTALETHSFPKEYLSMRKFTVAPDDLPTINAAVLTRLNRTFDISTLKWCCGFFETEVARFKLAIEVDDPKKVPLLAAGAAKE